MKMFDVAQLAWITAGVLNEFAPLSKQMAEQITALHQWAKGRARPATSPAVLERRLR